VEHLYLLKGEVEITVGDEVRVAKMGEAIRYRADMPHKIRNTGEGDAHANMILMLRQLGSPAN
jgi:XRE family transcriptional regulator, regulator of sulfur utilization